MLPRVGLSRTSYGGISLQSLYSLQLAPQISQNWWRYPPIRRAQCDRRGAPLGQAGKPRPKVCGPLPLPRGQATLQFWAVGGAHVVPNPQKSYLRLVWHQYVVGGGCGCTPVPRKKNRENGKTKFPNPLGPNFCKAHISKLVCAPPSFFCHCKVHIKKYPNMRKKNFHIFWTHPPKKNLFPAMPSSKSAKLRSFLYSSHK